MTDPGPLGAGSRPKALRDRAIATLARMLARLFFRSVEVEGPPLPDGPVIIAASHLNGFVDPVVLIAQTGFLPRFLAKGTLWKNAAARPALDFARVIPVHRRVDSDGAVDNQATFAEAVQALAQGGVVALFPEGTTHDEPTIAPLRTGVARIAVQAAAAGVDGVTIVPVGITYEDKVRVRGRALVSTGAPIPVPSYVPLLEADGTPDHTVVRDLTEQTRVAITELTPNFANTDEALALSTAAAIVNATPGDDRDVPLARITATARRLGRLDAPRRSDLVALVARYAMLLGSVRLHDDDISRGISPTALARRAVVLSAMVLVLSPFAAAGLAANVIPALAVLTVGLIPRAPVSKGTIRVLVAVVVFPLTWIVLALADASTGWFGSVARHATAPVEVLLGQDPGDRAGFVAGLLVLVTAPLFAAVALFIVERALNLVSTVVRWRTFVDRRGQLAVVQDRRAEVVATTTALLEAS